MREIGGLRQLERREAQHHLVLIVLPVLRASDEVLVNDVDVAAISMRPNVDVELVVIGPAGTGDLPVRQHHLGLPRLAGHGIGTAPYVPWLVLDVDGKAAEFDRADERELSTIWRRGWPYFDELGVCPYLRQLLVLGLLGVELHHLGSAIRAAWSWRVLAHGSANIEVLDLSPAVCHLADVHPSAAFDQSAFFVSITGVGTDHAIAHGGR